VRIELTGGPLAEFPLRVGLSMVATVHLDGDEAAPPPQRAASAAQGAELADADALVRRIIDANLQPRR